MTTREPVPASRWYSTAFRVRYQETDKMGVVYHANYLSWFESGRTEMFRGLGFAYRSLEEMGVLLPVTAADLQFKSPARYDDLIIVYARLSVFSPLRVEYEYEIRRLTEDIGQDSIAGSGSVRIAMPLDPPLPGELLVSGSTSHVWLNAGWKPVRLDRVLPELYQAITGALREEGGA
ncbi:thioesterase [Paenibacillus sp. FSL R7-0273]|uniref:acyl-CoA thioesterase n=1 Tax=Paenibacillus sp. FSL R7-0273 TaxID=1536772 RepID=UPI0004F5CE96|nr:thioesterase family protein [Paenibacillus sp. FSL R7-0273]AIQ46272.1 thioesterase [Paenibacillus sp. FSL R7-0273]OMF89381.1 thioesterase [Paenibacillus sp. FSL R7-0273]